MQTMLLGSLAVALLVTQVIDGQDEGDDFGTGLAVLGDVDGDGTDDFAVSDPYRENPDRCVGWIALVSGKTRAIIWEVWGDSEPEADEEEPAGFGIAICPLGDLDEDGIPDLAESSWSARPVTVRSGVDGEPILSFPGSTVASAGDVDGDGRCDLLVGPREFSEAADGERTTTVWLIRSGANGTILRTLSIVSASLTGSTMRAVALDDLDGGGRPDWGIHTQRSLVVFRAEDGKEMPTKPGAQLLAVALSRSSSAGRIATVREVGKGVQLTLRKNWSESAEPHDGTVHTAWLRAPSDRASPWGLAVESLGDVDGDHADDFLVALNPGSVLIDGCQVGVWSGSGGGPIWKYPVPDEVCETRMIGIGDLNEDGVRDVLVSGFWATGGPPIVGWVEALCGKTGARIFKLTRSDLSA